MTREHPDASLTRKLRLLIDLPEVVLTPEEAELFKIQTIDQLTLDELAEEKGEYDNE